MRSLRSSASRGFTLVELMIVVAILGILSSVAIVSYRRYALRSKVTEAYNLLGMIRMRQESYRSEFSQYCDVSSSDHSGNSGAAAGFWPSSSPSPTAVDWFAGLPAEWTQLGIRPTGQVYYRYDTVAGNPGVTPAFGGGLGYTAAPNRDAWWAAHAYGNIDGDSIRVTFESFSMADGIWASADPSE